MDRILVSGPSITQKEIDYVTDAVKNAWYSNANMYHAKFEEAFAEYVGRRYAIALPSCTAALHLALAAARVGSGDEVIVPEATWIATSAPISYVGATPVFADIDPYSWCLDVKSFETCITAKTKAVIVVNLYGNMPEMDAILEVASRHHLVVIEDAAESIGSEYRGRKAGSFGFASTFSFHGSKTLTTGEGGLLLLDDEDAYHRCLFLRDHGRIIGDKMFWNGEVAFKYKMSSMQAALGLAQLERVADLISMKRQIFSWYQEELDGLDGVELNREATHIKNTYWMVTVILDPRFGLQKEEVICLLSERKIDSRPFFYPLSSLPAYQKSPQIKDFQSRNTVSYRVSDYGINLPSGLDLTVEKVKYICQSLRDILHTERTNLP
jgi:perosamine synthetase